MIEKLFHLLYDTIIISIIHTEKELDIYVEIFYKKKLKATDTKKFTLNHSFKQEYLINYIETFTKDTPYYYIALLDNSHNQGVIPHCQESELYITIDDPKTICYEGKWGFYTSRYDIKNQLKFFAPLTIDFLFSPFLLLHSFFQDKINEKMAMYLLIRQESISVAIFQHSTLLYGKHIDTTKQEQEEEISLEEVEETSIKQEDPIESIDLESIDLEEELDSLEDLGGDLEELDSLDNLDNIEELDTLEEINDDTNLEKQLEENLENLEEQLEEKQSLDPQQSAFDFYRFSLLQKAMKEFYDDPRYESDFIDTIFVADSIGISKEFKRYIQEELFASVFIRSIDLTIELGNCVKKEIDYEL